jgi:hypothetical protein
VPAWVRQRQVEDGAAPATINRALSTLCRWYSDDWRYPPVQPIAHDWHGFELSLASAMDTPLAVPA